MKSITTLKVRYWNTIVLVSLLLCSLQSFAQDPEQEPEPSGPNIETDKPDYQPGDYVTITGSGWQPGETVSLDFHEDPKPVTCLLPHDMVAVADEFGNIYNNQFLVKLNHLGVTFTLTATGHSSGLTAQTIFTDDIQLWSNPITGSNPNTVNPYITGQTVASYITVSGIGRSSGISGVNASNRYNADGWTTSSSLSSSDYFYFILTPDAGYHIRFSDFVYDAQRSGQGPTNFAFRSNANGDNFTTNIGTPDDNGASISLSGSQFQNKTTATEFRFYGYNANSGAGTFSINSFVFNGSVLGTTVMALSGFSTCNNVSSNSQSFVVNGLGLTPNSTITIAPSVNFELSTTSAVAGFQGGGNVTLTASALGAVSGTVWVRLKAGATVGALSESINVSGGGFVVGDNVNVSVSGTVTQIPTIANHPQNTTITYGSNAGFSVASTGSGTLTYQWQVDTGSGTFTSISLLGIYADTDADVTTLEIALPPVSMNGYKYRVIVSGSCSPPATSNSATLTINKADAIIIVSGYSGTYDGNAHGASGSATGVLGEDLSTGLSLGSTFTDVPGGTANWTFSGGTNYNEDSGSVSINISKADAVISVNGYTGVYDGNAHGASGSATGVLGEDLSVSLSLGSTFTDVPGGTANWTFSGGTNYNDDSGSVAINISKADAVIVVNGYSGTYDGNAHGASGSATGVLGEDLSTGLSLGSTFTDVPGGATNWTFSGGTNYNDDSASVAISIGAKNVTVTAETKSKIFGDPDPEFTYLLSESLVAGNALNGGLSRANGESAGNYAINQGDLQVSTSNYTITFVTADLTIIMPPPMSAIVAKTNITCNGSTDGTITVTSPTGGLGIYEYRLNTGAWQASGSFTNLSAGIYTVQMRDPVRTIFSADLGNQTIIEPGVLNAQTSKTNVTCNGVVNGSIAILNPTGGSGSYEYRLNSDAWQSSPVFSGLAANTYTIFMRDAVNQSCEKNLGTQTISEPQALTATCTSSNNLLYFGYAGDQTSTINVKPSGGVGPYKVSITMNRPLKCNVVNNTGDEVWVPGSNTATNVDTSCPTTDTPSLLPISTSTFTINATVGYSLNVTLMEDATFTATITDSNGCITTCTTTIMAEDVRCFSGNSTRPKVNICHKTGSTKNPCVSICVDDNAVAEHLAHGDFLGKCTSNCLDPNGTRSLEEEETFNVKAYPNPSNSVFNLEIENGSEEEVTIEVFDISGRKIKQLSAIDVHVITFGEALPRGVYLVHVQQGSNSKTIRVVKE